MRAESSFGASARPRRNATGDAATRQISPPVDVSAAPPCACRAARACRDGPAPSRRDRACRAAGCARRDAIRGTALAAIFVDIDGARHYVTRRTR
jgi:hypothetical protein